MFKFGFQYALIMISMLYSLMSFGEEATLPCPKKPLKVGYTDFGIYYNEKTKTGLDKDIIQALFAKIKCPFEEKSYSRSALWTHLKTGKIDLSLSSVNTKERNRIAKFSYYGVAKTIVLFHPGVRAATLVEFTKNSGQRIGSVLGTSFGPSLDAELRELKSMGRMVEFSSEEKMFHAFKRKKIDVLILFLGVKERYFTPDELAKYSQTEWIGEIEPHGLAFSNKSVHAELFPWFDRELSNMVKSGEILTLAARYFSPEDLKSYVP
jgi:polar amino acid transport system substrate-binding protein